MMGGAIRARVEELTAPTNEMNRSRRGMAAPRATRRQEICLRKRSDVSHTSSRSLLGVILRVKALIYLKYF